MSVQNQFSELDYLNDEELALILAAEEPAPKNKADEGSEDEEFDFKQVLIEKKLQKLGKPIPAKKGKKKRTKSDASDSPSKKVKPDLEHDVDASPESNDYQAQRRSKMQQNLALLAELGIGQIVEAEAPPKELADDDISISLSEELPVFESVRQSKRIRGEAAPDLAELDRALLASDRRLSAKKEKKPKQPREKGAGRQKSANPNAARDAARQQLKSNPNNYYYRHNAPGDPPRFGDWSPEEHKTFMDIVKRFGVGSKWGLFASYQPGRVGYQCANYYREVLSSGAILDPNYRISSETGKAVFCAQKEKTGTVPAEAYFAKKKLKFEPIRVSGEFTGPLNPEVDGLELLDEPANEEEQEDAQS